MLAEEFPYIYTIHGQHDLSYHNQSSMKGSALTLLEAAGCLSCLYFDTPYYSDRINTFGASFGQEPIKPKKDDYNILVAHTMVGDKELYPGQKLTGPEQYVKKHPGYNLYCLGDYHYPFSVKVGDAWVINPGAMLRLKASERELEHRPKVVIFDTKTNTPKDIYLDVKPASEAFDLSNLPKKSTKNFEGFVERLKNMGELGVSFQENLQLYFEENKVKENIKKMILLAMKSA